MRKKKTKSEPQPEDFATKAEHEAALEQYYKQMPIYNIFNFFIGGPNKVDSMKSNVEGKPGQPHY